MQFRHIRTLSSNFKTEGTGRFTHRVVALAWSPNGYRLAVALADRNVYLFDERFELMDRFPTKPADKTLNKNYSIRGLYFSPDSTRLAVAQSDDIVFVYKLGESWEERKTICNKFYQQASATAHLPDHAVTSICWPSARGNEVVFGLANGEVKAGVVKLNKTVPLYSAQSYCSSVAALKDGHSVVSAHLDGAIFRYTFPQGDQPPTSKLLCKVPFNPLHIAVGQHVVIAGVNPQPCPVPQGTTLIGLNISAHGQLPAGTNLLYVMTEHGDRVQLIAFANEELAARGVPSRAFTSMAMAPAGHMLVCGGFDRFEAFALNENSKQWEHVKHVASVTNLCSIDSIAWNPDGSKLMTGAVGGALDVFDVCVRRELYAGAYEFVYTSASSAVLHDLASGSRVSIACKAGLPLERIDVFQKRYVVAVTSETLIVGDIAKGLVSEVNVRVRITEEDGKPKANARYLFDCEGACIAAVDGAIHVIQYGLNSVLYSTRSEHVSAHALSLALGPPMVLAHLLDKYTVRAVDVTSRTTLASVHHDEIVDWLELAPSGTKLLFRDAALSLVLVDLTSQEKTTLVRNCEYAQWAPDADVAVAQASGALHVWYNCDHPSDATIIPCPGTVVDIERSEVACNVIVNQGLENVHIPLNNTLMSFSNALKKGDLRAAVRTLEALPETETSSRSMWSELASTALLRGDFNVAQRCYAALEDVSKSAFLDHVIRSSTSDTTAMSSLLGGNNSRPPVAQARILALNKQWHQSINVLLESGNIKEAVAMCKRLHKWEDAIHIANTRNMPEKESLMAEYDQYLMQTHQEAVAGALREAKGEYEAAVDLYLRGGAAGKAAQAILKYNLVGDAALCDNVCAALVKSSLFELCGDVYMGRRMAAKALDTYRRGACFVKAVGVCRQAFPQQVVAVEEEWGDSLLAERQYESAITHYIEAHSTLKALHAAVEGKCWSRAMTLVREVDHRDAQPYYRRIGQYLAQIKKWDEASDMFRRGNAPQDAVQMFTRQGMWDKAYDIAKTFMGAYELTNLYVSQAQIVEGQWVSSGDRAKLLEAEKLLVTVGEVDRAIEMHKRHQQWDDMIRVVETHRTDLLADTFIHLARRFEKEGNAEMAEQYYLRAGDWRAVIAMHRRLNNWPACLAVSKQHGGEEAHRQACYAYLTWAKESGDNNNVNDALNYLRSHDMTKSVVDFCCERGEWEAALTLAEECDAAHQQQVWFQYAMALEDEGEFAKAEEYFLKANKPREAIEMHLHQRDWDAALRVCETHDESGFPEVYAAQARDAAERGDSEAAEKLFIAARQPQQAVNMYREAGKWDEAIRVASIHVPREIPSLEREKFRQNGGQNNNVPKNGPPGQSGNMGANAAPMPSPSAVTQDPESADAIVRVAAQVEAQGDLKKAISLLVKLGPHLATPTTPVSAIARHLMHAAQLAVSVMGNNAKTICTGISDTLEQMGEIDMAARVLSDIGMVAEAVNLLCGQQKFSAAEQLATRLGDAALAADVRKRHESHLAEAGDVGTLAQHNSEVAAEVYAKSGQWSKVLELAQKQGGEAVRRYAVNHASALAQDGKYRQALAVWNTYGIVLSPRNLLLYRRIAQEVCRSSEADGAKPKGSNETVSTPTQAEAWTMLKSSLRELCNAVEADEEVQGQMQANHADAYAQLQRLSKVAELQCRFIKAQNSHSTALCAKISTALLRYVADLHTEKAFYDAGYWSKVVSVENNGYGSHAYVLLNRFADIYHLVDDDQSFTVSNKEFADTEIPSPEKTPLPTSHAVSAADFDEIDMWLLDSIPSNPTLLTSPCPKCRKETFIGNLSCHVCRFRCEPCALTGLRLPSQPQMIASCTVCNAKCNKADFNSWVETFGTCPCCDAKQHAQY